MANANTIDDELLRQIRDDAYPESEVERLIIQEGWTMRDFEDRLREDGFLEDFD